MQRHLPHPAPIEEGIVRYLRKLADRDEAKQAEACFEHFARYLVDFSDLYRDQPESEPAMPEPDWGIELEDQMDGLYEMDEDRPALFDLGNVPIDRIEPDHLREFFGWYLAHEGADARTIAAYARILDRWLSFLAEERLRAPEDCIALRAAIQECLPEALRCARASMILHEWARHGGGMPPRLRGERFEDFVEGTARIVALSKMHALFSFEDEYGEIGPVLLPEAAIALLREGDVVDAEFGLRDRRWWLIDFGAVYPGCVYIDVGEMDGSSKQF